MASSPVPDPTHEGLRPFERKALTELRLLMEEVVATRHLLSPSHSQKNARVANSSPNAAPGGQDLAGISLWGVPLVPSRHHDGTDVVLLKFLRATDFKPLEALDMLRRTLKWRREFGADSLGDEAEPGVPGLRGAALLTSVDREGRPVSYDVFGGVFRERVPCRKAFGSDDTREKFLRSRVRSVEEGIKELSFKPGGVSSMVQVIDLRDSSAASTKEFRIIVRKLLSILDDYYPELVGRHIFVNVSFRYYAYHSWFSNNVGHRTRNKFVFARPSKVTETLLKFISPENIPIQYGGFHREDEDEFSEKDGAVSELYLKGGSNAAVEIPTVEPGVTVVWEVAVLGWEVHLKEEFIPDDECSYEVLIHKERKLEETTRNSFYISEPGKVVLTVINRTFKKKRVFYRSKCKPTIPAYNLLGHPAAGAKI